MEIVEKGERVEELYGLDEFTISRAELQALLDGKSLYGSINDEYAFTITLEE